MKIKVICTNHALLSDIVTNVKLSNPIELDENTVDKRYYLSGVYLHGEVEDFNGFDCVDLCDISGLETYTEKWGGTKKLFSLIPDGIYECEVYDYPNPCTLFMWHTEYYEYRKYRGLIVDNNDTESYESAKKAFEERESWI